MYAIQYACMQYSSVILMNGIEYGFNVELKPEKRRGRHNLIV